MNMKKTTNETGRADRRSGFSLVEVIVALVILTTGVMGLAATTMYVVRQTTLADVTTERSSAVQTVLERLRATPYASLASGDTTVGSFAIKWAVTTGSRTKQITLISQGPGLSSAGGVPALNGNVVDSFTYRILEP